MDTVTTVGVQPVATEVVERFLSGYWCARTRGNYRFILTGWRAWCDAHGHDVLAVDAAVLAAWVASMKAASYAPNTIAGRVSTVSAFYRWSVREQLVVRNPVELIRRPRRPAESSTASLTRHHQLTDWLAAAEVRGGAWWAAAMLLGLNGLRCGEGCAPATSRTSGPTRGTTP
jgi:integrase/recombinase XerD